MKKLIYTLAIGLFAFTACKSGESVSTNPADLQGDWKIMAMNGNEIPMEARSMHTVSFNTDGTVAGLAACNRFAGTYTAQQEGMVSMNSVSATKLECESDSESYVSALSSASSFQVKGGDELMLTSSTSSGSLVFTKVIPGGGNN